MENKISEISVEGRQTGVIGLEYAIQNIVEWAKGKNEDEISTELLSQLEKHNYIPSTIKEAYRKALLREYQRYLGQPVEEDVASGLQVLILGPGCSQCTSLESIVRNVMAEMNVAGNLRHVTDIKEIGRYGVMGTPALIINGKVVAVGSVPEKKKIKQWLLEAA